jgi:glycosyltransferase involved in cell wall biosynthesis
MVSFIIPAHNEERLLGATLDALQTVVQNLAVASEIIVVDDASTDRTSTIAAGRGVRVLKVEFRHIAATRNAGANIATGDVLVFVDADTLVNVAVVRAALDALGAGALGGGCVVRLHGDTKRRERIAAAFFGWVLRMARIAPGCFLFCTRDAFDAEGGFDSTWYAGEDVAMSRALAKRGKFAILRESVLTSGRKLRTFTFAEHARLVVRLAIRGRGLLKSRAGLELWYGDRR